MPLFYPQSCFHKNHTFMMVLYPISEVFTGLPPHSSPHCHRKGKGWGIKGQSSSEGPWGLYALPRPGGDQAPSFSAPQLTCRIRPPGRGPMGQWVLPKTARTPAGGAERKKTGGTCRLQNWCNLLERARAG